MTARYTPGSIRMKTLKFCDCTPTGYLLIQPSGVREELGFWRTIEKYYGKIDLERSKRIPFYCFPEEYLEAVREKC